MQEAEGQGIKKEVRHRGWMESKPEREVGCRRDRSKGGWKNSQEKELDEDEMDEGGDLEGRGQTGRLPISTKLCNEANYLRELPSHVNSWLSISKAHEARIELGTLRIKGLCTDEVRIKWSSKL